MSEPFPWTPCVCSHTLDEHHHCKPNTSGDPQHDTCVCDLDCPRCGCPGFITSTPELQAIYDVLGWDAVMKRLDEQDHREPTTKENV